MHNSDVLGEIFAAKVRPEQGSRNAGSKRKMFERGSWGEADQSAEAWAGPKE